MFSVSTQNHPAMQSDLLQQELFDHIRTVMPPNRSLADSVADLLRISPDSAYRRIRGEKSLSFAELQKLSTHFRISLDAILNIDTRSTVFYGNWLRARDYSLRNYLGGLLENLLKVSDAVQSTMYYEAKDLFPVHYLAFPQLAAFKYFFWLRSILHHPDYSAIQFEQHDLSEILAELSPAILKAYNSIPGTEVWSEDTFNGTLHQITHYRDAGMFRDAATADALLQEMEALAAHLRTQATTGWKCLPDTGGKPGAEFFLYHNPAYLGHNSIYTEADGQETVYVNHCVLNMMMTHDPEFCSKTRRYFEETMASSTLISAGGDAEACERFFEGLRTRVSCARKGKHGKC